MKHFALAVLLWATVPSTALGLSGGVGGGVGAHNGVGIESLAYFGGVADTHLGFNVARQVSVRASVTWMIFPQGDLGFDTGSLPPGFGRDAGETGAVQLISVTLSAQSAVSGLNDGYFVAGTGVYHALEFPGYSGTRFGLMGGMGVGIKTKGSFKMYLEGQVNVVDWPGGPMILMPIQLSISF